MKHVPDRLLSTWTVLSTRSQEGLNMFLVTTLNLLLDGRRDEDRRAREEAATEAFPAGRLTSAAWEGWWHEDAA